MRSATLSMLLLLGVARYLDYRAFSSQIHTPAPEETAGQVADHLKALATRARGLEESTHKRLISFATLFKELVERRNSLVHAEPFTGENGEQRLSYPGKAAKVDWTLAELASVAKRFEAASIEANELFTNISHIAGAG